MKILTVILFSLFILLHYTPISAQQIRQQQITPHSDITEWSDLRETDQNLTPEFKVTVNTRDAGKISATRAVISYTIRIDDTTLPMEHGVCCGTFAGPAITGPEITAKGYTTNTLYDLLSGLKPETRYFV